jgi:broad specificity phosphatase PhoE
MRCVVYLTRHGETEGNRENLFRGSLNFPLNEVGRKQARELAEHMKRRGYEVNRIVSSPLSRAVETAEIIAEILGVERVEVDENFPNFSFPRWEGRRKEEIAKEEPELWRKWVENPEEVKPEGGRSIEDLRRLSTARFWQLAKEGKGPLMIVSHRATIKALLAGVFAVEPPYFWKFHIDNCSLTVLEVREDLTPTLTLLNYTDHLSSFVVERV